MAKSGKNLQPSKDHQFDELIQKNWYYKEVYTYLLKFEKEFTDLAGFILNCERATSIIIYALINESNSKDLTIKYIIDNRNYYSPAIPPDYMESFELTEFELYLTKFIVGHCLIKSYKEDDKRTNYFNQIWSITQSQQAQFKYFVNYDRGNLIREKGVFYDWLLEFNSHDYVRIKKSKLTDLLKRLKESESNPEGIIKEIEPIKWQKNTVLLAYLINELKTYGYIDEESIWAICERVFVDKKGKAIKAETFTSMVKNYENNKTYDGTKGKPKAHTELTELINILKAISKEL